MRISTTMVVDNALIGINQAYERFAHAQEAAGTGKKLTKPSDDPNGLAQSLNLKNAMDNLDQYGRNADDALGFMGTVDSALERMATQLRSARTLAVQGANDTLDQPMRQNLGQQVTSIMDQIASLGNAQYGSRYVFSGQLTTQQAYTQTAGTYVYQGGTAANFNDKLKVEIGPTDTITVNTTGDQIFDPAFTALSNLRNNILGGQVANISNNDLDAIDKVIQSVSNFRGNLGANIQRIQQNKIRMDQTKLNFTDIVSKLTDADIPQAVLTLKTSELTYQTALASTARTFQQSLLDYLK